MNPFKNLSFAEKVNRLAEFDKTMRKKKEASSTNGESTRPRQGYLDLRSKELIILVLVQEIFYNGELCVIYHFRDITHSFKHRQQFEHLELENLMQSRIKEDIGSDIMQLKQSIKYLK